MKMNVIYPLIHQGIKFSEQIGTSESYKATYEQLVTLVVIGLYVYINCIDLLINHVNLSEMCCTHWVDVLTELL